MPVDTGEAVDLSFVDIHLSHRRRRDSRDEDTPGRYVLRRRGDPSDPIRSSRAANVTQARGPERRLADPVSWRGGGGEN